MESVDADKEVKDVPARVIGTKRDDDSGWFWTIFLPDGSVTLSDWQTALDVANRESARIIGQQSTQA